MAATMACWASAHFVEPPVPPAELPIEPLASSTKSIADGAVCPLKDSAAQVPSAMGPSKLMTSPWCCASVCPESRPPLPLLPPAPSPETTSGPLSKPPEGPG